MADCIIIALAVAGVVVFCAGAANFGMWLGAVSGFFRGSPLESAVTAVKRRLKL